MSACLWFGTMQVIPSPVATTAPAHGETEESVEPSPLLAVEGPGEPSTPVSNETEDFALRQPYAEPGPTNDNNPPERTKCRRSYGTIKTSFVAGVVEGASTLESSREEEETPKARLAGKFGATCLSNSEGVGGHLVGIIGASETAIAQASL